MASARFIQFHAIAADTVPHDRAPTFALALARAAEGVVLVFNRYRQVWELPGGIIDAGESAAECARRELAEEAGCDGQALEWRGLVEVEDRGRRFGAVFSCTVAAVPAQMRNEEIDGIVVWTPRSTVQPVGESDQALLERLVR